MCPSTHVVFYNSYENVLSSVINKCRIICFLYYRGHTFTYLPETAAADLGYSTPLMRAGTPPSVWPFFWWDWKQQSTTYRKLEIFSILIVVCWKWLAHLRLTVYFYSSSHSLARTFLEWYLLCRITSVIQEGNTYPIPRGVLESMQFVFCINSRCYIKILNHTMTYTEMEKAVDGGVFKAWVIMYLKAKNTELWLLSHN